MANTFITFPTINFYSQNLRWKNFFLKDLLQWKDTVFIIMDTLTVTSGQRLLVTMEAGNELKELVLVGDNAMEKMLVAVEVENKD